MPPYIGPFLSLGTKMLFLWILSQMHSPQNLSIIILLFRFITVYLGPASHEGYFYETLFCRQRKNREEVARVLTTGGKQMAG